MSKLKIVLSTILSALALYTNLLYAQQNHLVVTTPVQEKKFVFATLSPIDITYARSRTAGTIDGLSVDEGQEVKRGDIIAIVADEKQPLEIAAVDADLKSLTAEINLAKQELERIKRLSQRGVATKADLDKIESRNKVLASQYESLKAQREVLLERFSERQVLAPIDGRVLKVNVTNGTVVQPGENITQIATNLYILRLTLPERHARFLSENQAVTIYLNNEQPSIGKIIQIYPLIEKGRVTADIRVDALDSYFVGQRIKVAVPLYTIEKILIPKSLISTRYGIHYVHLKDFGEISIQTGQSYEDKIEVLSGLKVGDELTSL